MSHNSNFKQRRPNSKDFTIIPNDIILNPNLSAKAKGILFSLLTLPQDTKMDEKELERMFSDGLSSIKSGIKELEEAGHIKRERIRNEKGQLGGICWSVYEEPVFKKN